MSQQVPLHPWMSLAPDTALPATATSAFQSVLDTGDAAGLPQDLPIRLFLDWLIGQGFLLHGTPVAGIDVLRPQSNAYDQPDDFSNRTGVYAAADALWAMMYALRGPAAIGQQDMCLRQHGPEGWSERRYFYALAGPNGAVRNGRDLMAAGWVYVLDRDGFEASPAYAHGGLGWVQEAHWVSAGPCQPILPVPVRPEDFTLPVHSYDRAATMARAAADPWGFPWRDVV